MEVQKTSAFSQLCVDCGLDSDEDYSRSSMTGKLGFIT
jgi:hypothetical protein